MQHIAIIMDGNGRWAKAQNLPKLEGHRRGAEAARGAVKYAVEHKIPYLTLYAFSAENWARPEDEVSDLMGLLRYYIGRELDELAKANVRIKIIGDRAKLEPDIQDLIAKAEQKTANNSALTVQIALSYGSRQEIENAAQQRAEKGGNLADYLYTAGVPDPDLLIRTGGEIRISNFLLWQLAYTELYFTPILWPDFGPKEFDEALKEFERRERRFGRR